MFDRVKSGALLLVGIVLPIMGCGSSEVDSLQVTPTSITMAIGTTAQLKATGVYGHGTGPSTTQDLTNQVTWSTTSVDVATVSSTGIVTATGPGLIQITASIKGFTGLLSASSTITVPSSGTTNPVNNDISKLTIIPSAQTVASPGDTATYTAVGTTGAGANVNVNGVVVWSSSSAGIATVNASTGVVTAAGPGSATITAEYTNADQTIATGTATFTVTGGGASNTDITSVTIIPSTQTVASPGDTAIYTAIGTTASGQTESLNGVVVWSGSSPQIATVNASTGIATAVGPGTATIAAQYTNPDKTTATGTATFTVTGSGSTNSDITSVTIIPNAQTVAAPGDTAAYSVIGTTASGSTMSLTGLVVWSSSSPQIATVNASTGVATAVGPGTATISAQYTNSDKTTAAGTATFTVTGGGATNTDITTVTIVPSSQTVNAVGDTATFSVVGTTASGATQNLNGSVVWSGSSPQIANVNASTGVVTAVGPGTATIAAQYTNTDGTTATGTATFTVTGTGTTNTDITSVTIIPSSQTVAPGQTATYTAVGTTAAGLVENLTGVVVWTGSSPQIANVNASTGVVTAVGKGTATITALYTNPDKSTATGTAAFTVTGSATLSSDITSVAIIPNAQTVGAPGQTATYSAVGTTAGGATQSLNGLVVWSGSSPTIASVNASTGVVTAVGPGTATIAAQYTNTDGTTATGTATFTVTGNGTSLSDITSITIIPSAQSVAAAGDQATFVAVGTTGAGTTVSMSGLVTWTSSSSAVATINSATGVATAVGPGTAAITAQYINSDKTTATGTATLTVTGNGTSPNDITQVSIVPSSQTVAVAGNTATYTATGTTAAGVTKNLNGLVVWSGSNPQVANVNASTGVVTATGQGAATISAQYTNTDGTVATGTATFTVTGSAASPSDITAITVIPGSQSVPAPGGTATFVAVGTTASGGTVSLQGLATWSSSSSTIAQIANSATGVVTGVAAGSATITASYTNADGSIANGTASFTVLGGTTEQYTAVTILPSAQSITEGGTSNFIALGTAGSTGLIEDVTSSPHITWSSSIPATATISASGVALGVSAGSTTITALLSNNDGSVVSASASLTVQNGTPPEDILSLTIIPSEITVNNFYLTGQFLAIATYSTAPYVKDVTNDPATTWISTEPELFPVDTNSGGNAGASAGLVTAYASGGAVIVAETTNTDKTIETATATFSCPQIVPGPGVTNPSCYPDEPPAATLLATLTVYNEGLNTKNWLITAPSATGTPDVIHCGPAWVPTAQQPGTGSVCTATYPMNITTPAGTPGIVITATGGQFGGWSYNCIPSDALGNYLVGPNPWTAAGPNYCVLPFEGSYTYVNSADQTILVTVDGLNQTVGAIFN